MVVYLGKATPASGQGGGGSGEAVWGAITGTLSDQTDLAAALAEKQDVLTAGSNITIDNGVISATDTTYSAFGGATSSVAGSAGLVPAPAATDNDKYLKGDGTWATVSSGGATGSFTTADGKTVTVTNGVITSIVSGSGNVNLTFTVPNQKDVEYLTVNDTTYDASDFNDNAITLSFPSGTSITWSIMASSPESGAGASPSEGSFIITSDTTIDIDYVK
jgi:hypothetical protein